MDIESGGDSYPYAVGLRRIQITGKKLEASIVYPIDKTPDVYFDAKWLDRPETTMNYLNEVIGAKVSMSWPRFLLRSFTNISIPAQMNGQLA